MLIPKTLHAFGFDVVETVSMRQQRQRFTSVRLSYSYMPGLAPDAPPRLLAEAAYGCLKPPPTWSAPRDLPSSFVQHEHALHVFFMAQCKVRFRAEADLSPELTTRMTQRSRLQHCVNVGCKGWTNVF